MAWEVHHIHQRYIPNLIVDTRAGMESREKDNLNPQRTIFDIGFANSGSSAIRSVVEFKIIDSAPFVAAVTRYREMHGLLRRPHLARRSERSSSELQRTTEGWP